MNDLNDLIEQIATFGGGETNKPIADLIKDGLTKQIEVERSGRIWASQTLCSRRAALEATFKGIKYEPASMSLYCGLGIEAERKLIEGFENSGALLFKNYHLPDVGLDLGGYVDAIVKEKNRVVVLEIKTCGELPSKPKPEHKAQALAYRAITGLPTAILYQSRSVADWNGNLKQTTFPLYATRDEIVNSVFQIALARVYINEGMLPPKPNFITAKSHCGFCNYKKYCWDGVDTSALHLKDPGYLNKGNFLTKATEMTKAITDESRMLRRRNGILKHISKWGTDEAKTFLRGDWSEIKLNW